jgi:hypothetical protein
MHAGLDSHQQRLRLSDLRHFWRRRETFERGRKDGVGVDKTAGGLVESGEAKSSPQTPAARALLSRYGDGALESFFGGGRIWRTSLEQSSPRRRWGNDRLQRNSS